MWHNSPYTVVALLKTKQKANKMGIAGERNTYMKEEIGKQERKNGK